MNRTLQIDLLGSFQMRYGGESVTTFESPRLQSLLAYLLLHQGIPQPRQQIAFQFWPVSSESQARTNLRKLLLQFRRALPAADQFFTSTNQTLLWHAEAPSLCDVTEIQQLLANIEENPLARDGLMRLSDLYRGELLPTCYDEWITPLRRELHHNVTTALERLVTLLENQRAYEEGVRYAQRLLTFEPLEEKGYQRLMRLHALNGDRAGALRAYQECEAILQRELDVPPSEETQTVYAQLLEQAMDVVSPAEPQPARLERIPLVGRQREWQQLQQAWQMANREGPHLLSIQGEAGIGKTRLAEELFDWATVQGALTARTRAYQAQGAMAYAPVTELLRNELLYTRLERLEPIWLAEITRLLPELSQRHPTLPLPQPLTESWQRQRFFEALARAVVQTDSPMLLLLDDLQWCERETLQWLEFLLRFDAQAQLLVVGTIRTGEANTERQLATLLRNLQRDDLRSQLTLAPLSAMETADLARQLRLAAADSASGDVSKPVDNAATNEQLFAETAGNPLFIVETVRAGLRPATALSTGAEETGLPPKIYAVIQARLAQLSPETQSVINLAAVIGRSFSYAVLTEAARLDEEELIDCLDELWQRQIIREQGTDTYDFSHDRIRDVAYSEISRTRRRLLHRRVAEALEQLQADNQQAVAGLLAEQYAQAGNRERSLFYLRQAGDQAISRYAHDEALRYLTQAIVLTDGQQFAERCQLYFRCMTIFHAQGEMHHWKENIDQLAATIAIWQLDNEANHEANNDALSKWQAILTTQQATYESRVGDHKQAVRLGQEAVQLACATGDLQLAAEAHLGLAHAAFICAEFALARQHAEDGAQAAKAVYADQLHVKNLETLMQVYMFSGGSAEQIRTTLDRCMEIHRRTGNLKGQADIYNKYAYLPMAQGEGDLEQAEQEYADALAISQRIGHRALESTVLRNRSVLATCQGNYRQALADAEVALQIDHKSGMANFAAIVLNYLGFAYFNQGRLHEAKEVQLASLHLLRQHNVRQWELKALTALGWIYYYLNDVETAQTYLQEGLDKSRAMNEARQEGYTLTCLGHLLTTTGNFEQAATAYQRAVTLHRQLEQINRSQEPLAGLAHLQLQQGDGGFALAQLEPILAHLDTNSLFLTEEAFHVYLFGYRILVANGDQQAVDLLHLTYQQLQARAAAIDDPAHRRMFWETMPGHREIREAWKRLSF